MAYRFFLSQQRVGIYFFKIFIYSGNGQKCLNFLNSHLNFFTLSTLLHEVVMRERVTKIFTIEVKILWQQCEFICKKKDFDILYELTDLVSNGIFFASDHALL